MVDPFSKILKRSTDVFQTHFTTFLVPALLLAAVVNLPAKWAEKQIPAGATLADLGGAALGVLPVAILLAFVGALYMMVAALEEKDDVGFLLKRTSQLFVPFIVTYFWILIYSYGWLLIVGGLLAAIDNPLLRLVGLIVAAASVILLFVRGPRLAFAPIILVKRKLSPRASVQASLKETEGHWGKIVGNYLLLMLCIWLISFGIGFILGVLASLLEPLGESVDWVYIYLGGFIQNLFNGLVICFFVQLGYAVLGNSKRSA